MAITLEASRSTLSRSVTASATVTEFGFQLFVSTVRTAKPSADSNGARLSAWHTVMNHYIKRRIGVYTKNE
jgi:hypothetical protein